MTALIWCKDLLLLHSFNAIDIHRFQDLQNKIRTKAPLNIVGAAPVVDYKGETFLSQELALNLLYEAKLSLSRCQLVRIACLDSRHSGVSTQVSSNGGGGGGKLLTSKKQKGVFMSGLPLLMNGSNTLDKISP